MKGSKKCPNCNQWSEWNQDKTDRCEYCGALLAPEVVEREENREKRKKEQEDEWIFNIQPDDSPFKVFLKKIGKVGYVIFMAIVSFIVWLIAFLPG
ncbi:hypothetical protein [Catalinimonas niigatensis]|uniref:hypothetical protein n=1 Tax=Catalinimonas niigatensis TaxID=1397264 RepID=UPI002666E425|nr:hypothetical protein [Catalinimonas niigatensis]WPP51120.1 hypothetical protein PZB72_01765 [Catalinimonas niigatensis]